jgi:hypothetical protein
MCSRSLCWIVSLTAVLLFLVGCDDSDNTAVFDFSTQSLCDWFSPEEIDEIVTSTYEELGVQPVPERLIQIQDATSDCYWGGDTMVGLSHQDEWTLPAPFTSHAALDDSVSVSTEGNGLYIFSPGIAALLIVDGHDEQLWLGHEIPYNVDGDVEMINTVGLTIANKMLQQMGWVDSN